GLLDECAVRVSTNGTANGLSVQLSVRSRQNSGFGGFSAISDLIVYPRLTDDDDAIVEDGFQVRPSCRPSGAFVARNLETSGTTIRRLEISRASATIRAIGAFRDRSRRSARSARTLLGGLRRIRDAADW